MGNRKRRIVIATVVACAVVGLVVFHLLTWGLVVETGVRFDYVLPDEYDFHRPDPPPEKRVFVPDHYYLSSTEDILRTWIIVSVVYRHRLPFDISMWRSDPTYLKSHKEFTSFTIDSFSLTYADGTVGTLINTNSPTDQRTYEITPNGGTIQFSDAVTKAQDFTVLLSGYSTKNTGETIPFNVTNRYRCVPAFRVYPLAGSF